MPELPEVETTTVGLKKVLLGLKITKIWTDLATPKPKLKYFNQTLKSLDFLKYFKKKVIGQKIISVNRRAKNILINLANDQVILIHLKMTGHLLFGKYTPKKYPRPPSLRSGESGQAIFNIQYPKIKRIKTKEYWRPKEKGPLNDPYNRFIHVVFSLSNGQSLAFCDARKFGKITLIKKEELETSPHLKNLGPEPLDPNFTFKKFKDRINKKPNGRIKTVLLDQTIMAGIGNIYSDEILWASGLHPEEKIKNIENPQMKKMFLALKKILKKGISLQGDSTSDYRNILGQKGEFQFHHQAYQRQNKKCSKIGCQGVIIRKVVGSRSAHFCNQHQKLVSH